jgi:hypothetical protein
VRGRYEQLRAWACFDNMSCTHDRDTAGHLAHHGKIMRDKEHGQTVLALEAPQQFKHLRLHRYIERGGWLVGNEQLWTVDERHGNKDALPLAA